MALPLTEEGVKAAKPRPCSLSDLLAGEGGKPTGVWQGIQVNGVATDSRRVVPGDLFFALAGERHRGIQFIGDALKRGAVAVVAESASDLPDGVPGLAHPNPSSVLCSVSAKFYQYPARHVAVSGVTGTNGKTTTTLMMAAMLREAGRAVAHWTTTEVEVGSTKFRPYWTTPPPPDLHRFLAMAVEAGIGHAVLEVSSHGLSLGRLHGLHLASAAVTNVTADHIDFHGSREEYVAAKRLLVESLDEAAWCSLNLDDPTVASFATATRAQVITYGTSTQADIHVSEVSEQAAQIAFALQINSPHLRQSSTGRWTVRVPMPGRHNALNAAAAAASVLPLGVPEEAAIQALAHFVPPPRRLEARRIGRFTIVNDVAMNEASYEAVLQAVADFVPSQLVVVHALRGHRGEAVSSDVAGVLARWNRKMDFAPLHVSLSRRELAGYGADVAVRDEERSAFARRCAEEGLAIDVHEDLLSAIHQAVERLKSGGILLLLGTFGMDEGPQLAAESLALKAGVDPGPPLRYLRPSYGDTEIGL